MNIKAKKIIQEVPEFRQETTVQYELEITETRVDEAGNEYEYTRKERNTVPALQAQKQAIQDQADKQIAEIDAKLAKMK